MGDNWTIGDGVNESNPGVLNNDLSKSAAYNYYNHQMDVTFRWIREKMRLNAGVSFQPQKSDLSYKKVIWIQRLSEMYLILLRHSISAIISQKPVSCACVIADRLLSRIW